MWRYCTGYDFVYFPKSRSQFDVESASNIACSASPRVGGGAGWLVYRESSHGPWVLMGVAKTLTPDG